MGKPGSSCQQPLEAKKVCVEQTMTAILSKKGKVWRGELPYFIIRGNYERVGDKFKLKNWYRHGVTQKLVIREM